MEGYYYGYPRRNYSFNPFSNPNSVYYQNPYYNANTKPNPNSYHNLNTGSKPRVVSIPIQFVNSDSSAAVTQAQTQHSEPVAPKRPSPEIAALKIQKMTRGFLVRKNYQVVRRIEDEAEEIGREITRDEMVLEKDVKARIRVGEMLMNLLLRLDSVRGVRDYRKKVIRKVISLQELVDSIAARADKSESVTIEVQKSDQNPSSLQIEEDKVTETVNPMEVSIDATNPIDTSKSTEHGSDLANLGEDMAVEAPESGVFMEESPIVPLNLTKPLQNQTDKLDEKSNSNPDEELSDAPESEEVRNLNTEMLEEEVHNLTTEMLEPNETAKGSNQAPESSLSQPTVSHDNNNNNDDDDINSNEMETTNAKGVRDVMERVMIESEKMKTLMEELCQRSMQQWQLMEGLVNRVQRLEREVERMERREKKKKRKGNGRKGESLSRKCCQSE